MNAIEYVLIAITGGITRAVLISRSIRDLTRWDALKILILSPIAGYLYYNMVVEWGAPDKVVAFFFAYAFIDIIDRLAKRILSLFK